MSDALVRAAFEVRLAAWAAAQTPPIPVSYELVPLDPPATRYIRCWLLPVPTQSNDLAGLHRLRQGVFQVDLCIPQDGKGTAAPTALAASLDAYFPLTGPLEQGSIKVYLTTPLSPAQPRPEGAHSVTAVSCEYKSHTI
jgi:hypothetical protein